MKLLFLLLGLLALLPGAVAVPTRGRSDGRVVNFLGGSAFISAAAYSIYIHPASRFFFSSSSAVNATAAAIISDPTQYLGLTQSAEFEELITVSSAPVSSPTHLIVWPACATDFVAAPALQELPPPVEEPYFESPPAIFYGQLWFLWQLVLNSGLLVQDDTWDIKRQLVALMPAYTPWLWNMATSLALVLALFTVTRSFLRRGFRSLQSKARVAKDFLWYHLGAMWRTAEFWVPIFAEGAWIGFVALLFGTCRALKSFIHGTVEEVHHTLATAIDLLFLLATRIVDLWQFMRGNALSPQQKQQAVTLVEGRHVKTMLDIRGQGAPDTMIEHSNKFSRDRNGWLIPKLDAATADISKTFSDDLRTYVNEYASQTFEKTFKPLFQAEVASSTEDVSIELKKVQKTLHNQALADFKVAVDNKITESLRQQNRDVLIKDLAPTIESQARNAAKQHIVASTEKILSRVSDDVVRSANKKIDSLTADARVARSEVSQLSVDIDNLAQGAGTMRQDIVNISEEHKDIQARIDDVQTGKDSSHLIILQENTELRDVQRKQVETILLLQARLETATHDRASDRATMTSMQQCFERQKSDMKALKEEMAAMRAERLAAQSLSTPPVAPVSTPLPVPAPLPAPLPATAPAVAATAAPKKKRRSQKATANKKPVVKSAAAFAQEVALIPLPVESPEDFPVLVKPSTKKGSTIEAISKDITVEKGKGREAEAPTLPAVPVRAEALALGSKPVVEPATAKPVIAQPVVNQPVIFKPVVEPVVAEPVVEPVVIKPVVAEPVVEPVVVKPAVAEPVIAKPAEPMVEPVVVKPAVAEPDVVKPTEPVIGPVVERTPAKPVVAAVPSKAEPVVVQPVAPAPVISAPVISAPVISAPVISAPVISAPVISAPVISDPMVVDPVISDPVDVEPMVVEPVVPEPVVSPPLFTKPIFAQPVPVQPVAPVPVVTPAVQKPNPDSATASTLFNNIKEIAKANGLWNEKVNDTPADSAKQGSGVPQSTDSVMTPAPTVEDDAPGSLPFPRPILKPAAPSNRAGVQPAAKGFQFTLPNNWATNFQSKPKQPVDAPKPTQNPFSWNLQPPAVSGNLFGAAKPSVTPSTQSPLPQPKQPGQEQKLTSKPASSWNLLPPAFKPNTFGSVKPSTAPATQNAAPSIANGEVEKPSTVSTPWSFGQPPVAFQMPQPVNFGQSTDDSKLSNPFSFGQSSNDSTSKHKSGIGQQLSNLQSTKPSGSAQPSNAPSTAGTVAKDDSMQFEKPDVPISMIDPALLNSSAPVADPSVDFFAPQPSGASQPAPGASQPSENASQPPAQEFPSQAPGNADQDSLNAFASQYGLGTAILGSQPNAATFDPYQSPTLNVPPEVPQPPSSLHQGALDSFAAQYGIGSATLGTQAKVEQQSTYTPLLQPTFTPQYYDQPSQVSVSNNDSLYPESPLLSGTNDQVVQPTAPPNQLQGLDSTPQDDQDIATNGTLGNNALGYINLGELSSDPNQYGFEDTSAQDFLDELNASGFLTDDLIDPSLSFDVNSDNLIDPPDDTQPGELWLRYKAQYPLVTADLINYLLMSFPYGDPTKVEVGPSSHGIGACVASWNHQFGETHGHITYPHARAALCTEGNPFGYTEEGGYTSRDLAIMSTRKLDHVFNYVLGELLPNCPIKRLRLAFMTNDSMFWASYPQSWDLALWIGHDQDAEKPWWGLRGGNVPEREEFWMEPTPVTTADPDAEMKDDGEFSDTVGDLVPNDNAQTSDQPPETQSSKTQPSDSQPQPDSPPSPVYSDEFSSLFGRNEDIQEGDEIIWPSPPGSPTYSVDGGSPRFGAIDPNQLPMSPLVGGGDSPDYSPSSPSGSPRFVSLDGPGYEHDSEAAFSPLVEPSMIDGPDPPNENLDATMAGNAAGNESAAEPQQGAVIGATTLVINNDSQMTDMDMLQPSTEQGVHMPQVQHPRDASPKTIDVQPVTISKESAQPADIAMSDEDVVQPSTEENNPVSSVAHPRNAPKVARPPPQEPKFGKAPSLIKRPTPEAPPADSETSGPNADELMKALDEDGWGDGPQTEALMGQYKRVVDRTILKPKARLQTRPQSAVQGPASVFSNVPHIVTDAEVAELEDLLADSSDEDDNINESGYMDQQVYEAQQAKAQQLAAQQAQETADQQAKAFLAQSQSSSTSRTPSTLGQPFMPVEGVAALMSYINISESRESTPSPSARRIPAKDEVPNCDPYHYTPAPGKREPTDWEKANLETTQLAMIRRSTKYIPSKAERPDFMRKTEDMQGQEIQPRTSDIKPNYQTTNGTPNSDLALKRSVEERVLPGSDVGSSAKKARADPEAAAAPETPTPAEPRAAGKRELDDEEKPQSIGKTIREKLKTARAARKIMPLKGLRPSEKIEALGMTEEIELEKEREKEVMKRKVAQWQFEARKEEMRRKNGLF